MKTAAWALLRLSTALDAVVLAAVLTLSSGSRPAGDRLALFAALLTIPTWIFLLRFFGLYESQRVSGFTGLARKVLSAYAAACVLALPFAWTLGNVDIAANVMALLAAGCLAVLVEKWAAYGILKLLRSRGFDARNVCVVGTLDDAAQIAERISQSPWWGLRVRSVGLGEASERRYVAYPDGEPLGGALAAVLRSQAIDEVLLTVPAERLEAERATLRTCDENGVATRLLWKSAVPGERAAALRDQNAALIEVFGEPVVTLGGPTFDDQLLMLKRLVDIALSAVALVLLVPVFAAVALMVKLSSPGPVIFRQRRTGLHGREFVLYKFRTMIRGADAMLPYLTHRGVMGGPIFKDPADVRVTPIGRVLRRFSLDELPQFWNVLTGDMSLVGPRPLPVYESAAIAGMHRRRFSMRPGITCLWQVNGRSECDYARWMQYDLEYVDRWSLALDAKLLLRTVPVVFTGRGAC